MNNYFFPFCKLFLSLQNKKKMKISPELIFVLLSTCPISLLGVVTVGNIKNNGIPPFRGNTDPGKRYGDMCESMEYCHGELVSCQHGVCSCSNPGDMIYDELSHGCVVLVGKKCEIQINSENLWKVSVNCVPGGICDADGYCRCSDEFYHTGSGTCLKKKLYKESCSSDMECASTAPGTKALVCLEGECSCEKRGQVFDESKTACVSLVDAECDQEDKDVDCTPNAVCRQGRCSCKSGYAKSSSSRCNLGFGADCIHSEADLRCADIYFMCLNGQCQCKHPLHQIFDERTQECLSLVSGPCTFPKQDQPKNNVSGFYDIQKCVKNAHCVDKGFYSECECKPGFVETQSGTCAPGYGQSCEVDDCDPITPLFCRNGVCECYDLLQYFDPVIRKCVGLVGSRCTTQKPNCVEFASCVIPQPGKFVAGQCTCDKYAVESKTRFCEYI